MDKLIDALEAVLGNMEATSDFDQKLADLLRTMENADPEAMANYHASAMSFASCATACVAMWHVEHHNGVDCARALVQESALELASVAMEACAEGARAKSVANPFEAADVNAATTAEILAELNKETVD